MASGFFALFDDIATLMDDVSAMTKIATKKTVGILGDDLAVNAEKATGFVSSRELPVIWAITKGSFLNKLIILPIIVLLSVFAKFAIVPILLIGGLYLAYEGAEKVYEYLFYHKNKEHHQNQQSANLKPLTKEGVIIAEKQKIRSAIITDFILSLEIIIIALSTVSHKNITTQIMVLILVGILTTLGVYGIVALIVRLDDIGYKLIAKGKKRNKKGLKSIGIKLVKALPFIIKALSIVGTMAMFLVAGGIYVHNIHLIHDFLHGLPSMISEFLVGVVLGFIVLLLIKSFSWIKLKSTND